MIWSGHWYRQETACPSIGDLMPHDDDIVHVRGKECDCRPEKKLQMDGPHVTCGYWEHFNAHERATRG